jgi:hypothetical protein
MDEYKADDPQHEVRVSNLLDEEKFTSFQHQRFERIIHESQKLVFKRVAIDAQNLVSAKLEWLVDEYLKRFGRVIDTDLARLLFPDWTIMRESRELLSTAIFEPARTIARRAWEKLLSEPLKSDEANYVIFITGGPASGKEMMREQLIRNMKASGELFPHVIFDTTMSEYTVAKAQIEQALSRSFVVHDLYIHRPIQNAKEGAEERRKFSGRQVEENFLIDSHWGAQQTVLQLANDYRNIAEVVISILDNSGLPEDIHSGSIETTIEPTKYLSREDIVQRLEESNYRPSS